MMIQINNSCSISMDQPVIEFINGVGNPANSSFSLSSSDENGQKGLSFIVDVTSKISQH